MTIQLAILAVLLWIGLCFTVGVTLIMAAAVSERRLQSAKRDEFLYLMEHRGYASVAQAEWCRERIQHGDYAGAVIAIERGLFEDL